MSSLDVDSPDLGLNALRSRGEQPASPLARLRRLAALERADLVVACIYGVATSLVSLAVPIAAQSLVNTVAFTGLVQPIVVLAAFVLLGLLLAGLSRTVQQQVIEKLHQRFFVRATHELARRALRADLLTVSERSAPQLMNRFFDVMTVQKAASTLLVDGLSAVLSGVAALVLLAFYHPALLAFDLVLVAAILFILLGLGRGGISTAVKESKLKHETGAWLEHIAGALRAFKGPRAAAFAFARADALAQDYVRARSKHFRLLLRQIVASYVLQALATAGLLGLGGFLVLQGQLTLGQLVAAEIAVTGVLASLAKSGKHLEHYYDLLAALDKVGTLVDLPSERRGTDALERGPEGARVELIDVGCPPLGTSPGLSGVCARVTPSSPLAVLGEESDGRTSLVSLLYGAFVPTHGRIELDGKDIRAARLADLRRDVALVDRPNVFEGSIAENLHWGPRGVDGARLSEVLALVDLGAEVRALGEGMSTLLSSARHLAADGPALRLTLARALLSEPRLLLLDGALDAFDGSFTRRLLSGIRESFPDLALIVFTRREDIAREVGRAQRLTRGVLGKEELWASVSTREVAA